MKGFDILDQTQRKKMRLINLIDKDEFNPAKETINKYLNTIINSSSDISGFTLTFNKKYHNDDDRWLNRHVHDSIIKSKIWKDKKYIIIPEYTKKGNLHYHGIMWDEYHSEVMKCIKWWRRKFGFVKPELVLSSKFNWIQYITKNYGKTGLWTIHNIKDEKSVSAE